MANHGYKFIDPDLHVFEPSDLWTCYIAPEFRDQAPVGSDAFVGDMYLMHEGKVISRGGRIPMMGSTYDHNGTR